MRNMKNQTSILIPLRNDTLDSIRGIAIFGVLIVHFLMEHISRTNSPILFSLAGSGARGVQLFFLISSVTLFLSLSIRKGEESQVAFFIRRFFRIWPLYAFTLFLFTTFTSSFTNMFLHLTFLNVWHPTYINNALSVEWSLAVEAQFYLFVPLLFSYISGIKRSLIFLFLSLILFVINHKVLEALEPLLLNVSGYDFEVFKGDFSFFSNLYVFAFGILLFFCLYGAESESWKKKLIKWADAITIAGCALFVLSVFEFINLGAPMLPYCLSLSLVIYGTFLQPHAILVNRFWNFLGRRSYSLYLLHLPAMGFAKTLSGWFPIMQEPIVLVLSGFAISILVSSLSFKFIEIPMISLGNQFAKKWAKT